MHAGTGAARHTRSQRSDADPTRMIFSSRTTDAVGTRLLGRWTDARVESPVACTAPRRSHARHKTTNAARALIVEPSANESKDSQNRESRTEARHLSLRGHTACV